MESLSHKTSNLFKDVRFLLTAISEKEVEGITALINLHDGKVLNFISESPTYVLTELDDPKAPELSEALEIFRVPVINVSWIRICCALRKIVPSSYFDINRPNIFRRMRAVVSDSLSNDVYQIWVMLVCNGGRLTTKPDNTTTHAIVSNTADIKALNINTSRVHVVTPDWLTESISAGVRKREYDFHPAHLITAGAAEVAPTGVTPPDNAVAAFSSSSANVFNAAEYTTLEQMLLASSSSDAAPLMLNKYQQQVVVKPDTKSALAKLLSDRQHTTQHPAGTNNNTDLLPLGENVMSVSSSLQLQPGANSFSLPMTAATSSASFSTSLLARVAAPVLHAPPTPIMHFQPGARIGTTLGASVTGGLRAMLRPPNTSSVAIRASPGVGDDNYAVLGKQKTSGMHPTLPVSGVITLQPPALAVEQHAPTLSVPLQQHQVVGGLLSGGGIVAVHPVTTTTTGVASNSTTQVHHPLLNQMLSSSLIGNSAEQSKAEESNNNMPIIQRDSMQVVVKNDDNDLSMANKKTTAAIVETPATNDSALNLSSESLTNNSTTATTSSNSRSRKGRKREASNRPRMQSGAIVAAGVAVQNGSTGANGALTMGTPTKRVRTDSPQPPAYCTSVCNDDDEIECPKDLFFVGCWFYLARADLQRTYRGENAVFIAATEQLIMDRGGMIVPDFQQSDDLTNTPLALKLPRSAFIVSVQRQPEFMPPKKSMRKNNSAVDVRNVKLIDSVENSSLVNSFRHVTPDWLWHCDAHNQLTPPETLLHLPVPDARALADWRICFANFTTTETRLLTQYTAALGAAACEYLTRNCDLVVCKSLLGHKFTAAIEWQKPTVNCMWLADVLLHGRMPEQANFYADRYQEFVNLKTSEDALRALKVVEHRNLADKGGLMHGWLEPIRFTTEQIRTARERHAKHVENQSSDNGSSPPGVVGVRSKVPGVASTGGGFLRRFSVELYEDRIKRLRSDRIDSTVLDADAAAGAGSTSSFSNLSTAAAAAGTQPPAITITGFSVGETFDLRERVLRLGARFVDEVSAARVLVAEAPSRTLKFLAAINCCPHIVSTRWLDACEHAGKLLLDDATLAAHCLSKKLAVPANKNKMPTDFDIGRSLRERDKTGLGKLFSKMAFHIAPAAEFGRGSLEYLIETGGGSFEQPFKSWSTVREGQRAEANCRMIAIGHPQFPDEYRYLINHGIAVYSPEFIIDAVLNQALDYGRNRIDKPFRISESSSELRR